MSTVPNFLHFTINAVLHPTFIRELCYKLSSIVTFTFIQIFLSKLCLLYWMASELPRLIDTASKFALFSVSGLKDEKLIKNKSTWKLKHANSILETFEYFCQISSKLNVTISQLYRFKVGAFFETRCISRKVMAWMPGNGCFLRISLPWDRKID